MVFKYIFGKEKQREDTDNPVIDDVVARSMLGKEFRPSLSEIHKMVPLLYMKAKAQAQKTLDVRSKWVWNNMRWNKKK